jgi:hypothetical protein
MSVLSDIVDRHEIEKVFKDLNLDSEEKRNLILKLREQNIKNNTSKKVDFKFSTTSNYKKTTRDKNGKLE